MSDTKPDTSNNEDMAVMASVLDAEAAAAARIDEAHRKAATLARDAQANARRIAGRADKRIQRLHRTSEERVARKKVEAAIAFDERDADGPQAFPDEIISEAVRRLALRLIGREGA